MKSNVTILSGILAVVLVAAFVNTNRAAVRDLGSGAEVPGVRGDLKVSYDLVSEGGATTTSGQVRDQACSEIEFHQEYVVLKYKLGGGRVLPLSEARNLRWDGK